MLQIGARPGSVAPNFENFVQDSESELAKLLPDQEPSLQRTNTYKILGVVILACAAAAFGMLPRYRIITVVSFVVGEVFCLYHFKRVPLQEGPAALEDKINLYFEELIAALRGAGNRKAQRLCQVINNGIYGDLNSSGSQEIDQAKRSAEGLQSDYNTKNKEGEVPRQWEIRELERYQKLLSPARQYLGSAHLYNDRVARYTKIPDSVKRIIQIDLVHLTKAAVRFVYGHNDPKPDTNPKPYVSVRYDTDSKRIVAEPWA